MDGGVSPRSSPPNLQGNRFIDNNFPPLIEPQKGLCSNGTTVEGSPSGGNKIWKALFVKEKEDSSVGKLPYFKPLISEGKKLLISPTDFVEEIRVCEKSLVGFFLGRRFAFPNVEATVKKVWNPKGNFRLTMNGDSIFYFDFDLEEDRVTALEHGSMLLGSRLFMIKPWHLFVEESILEMKTIPIWLNLRKIPLQLWNPKGIGMIASVLGTPLLADKHTLARTRMNFARVCVEVEIEFDFPDSIPISFGGKDLIVPVEYSWKPPRCIPCATFGHSSSHCPKVKRVWIPKRNAEISENVVKATENVVSLTDVSSEGGKIAETNELVIPPLIDSIPRLEVAAKELGQPADGGWTVYSSRKNKKKHNKQGEVPTSHLSPFTSLFSASEVANLHGLHGTREVEPVDVDNLSGIDTQVAGVNSENGDDNLGIRIEELVDPCNGEKQESSKARLEELDDGEDPMEESEYETDVEEMTVEKVKPLKEVSRHKPMDKKQNLEKIFAFTSKIVKGSEGNGMIEKAVDNYHQSRVKDLGPSSEDLGRGKRTPIPNKKV